MFFQLSFTENRDYSKSNKLQLLSVSKPENNNNDKINNNDDASLLGSSVSSCLSLSPTPPLSHFQIVGNPNERDITVSSYLLGLEYHVQDTSEWKL